MAVEAHVDEEAKPTEWSVSGSTDAKTVAAMGAAFPSTGGFYSRQQNGRAISSLLYSLYFLNTLCNTMSQTVTALKDNLRVFPL